MSKHDQSQEYWRLVGRQFRRNRMALAAGVLLVVLTLIAIAAPFLANDVPIYMVKGGKTYWLPNVVTYSDLQAENFYKTAMRWQPAEGERASYAPIPFAPVNQILSENKQPPSARHWLGTDDRGRSVAARLVWGARISLSVGFVAEGISLIIGVILGALAGYYGGRTDAWIMRGIEIVMCFPAFFLILALVALLPPSIFTVMGALGVLGWTGIARLTRGEFLKLRESQFALAARASGLSDARIIFRHLVPNALAPVLVSATFGVADAILTESALSFLGFGVPPPTASWGELLSQSQRLAASGIWWLVVFPGLAIFITVTAFNLVGEGLRDAMDPRLRQ